MLGILKQFFGSGDEGTPDDQPSRRNVRVATCALFLELARSDEAFTEEETDAIFQILKDRYGISGEEADALIAAAEEELEDSVDYWRFARRINRHYSIEEKIEIVELMWRIVYVDGKLDKYEDYLMHQMGNILRLDHGQLMAAKTKVLHERNGR
jgi:uncharacterized tellurite resistance protein B-like protein